MADLVHRTIPGDRPIIGLTAGDVDAGAASAGAAAGDATGSPRSRFALAPAYVDAVSRAGGLPLILPQAVEHVERYVQLCDGLLLTGGDDPRTEPYGQPTHPNANPMPDRRQTFECALLATAERLRPEMPVLGVCLGMQLMALEAGGQLDQYLPQTMPRTAADHQEDRRHAIELVAGGGLLGRLDNQAPRIEGGGLVVSAHRQAVAEAGRLRVIARAPDGVTEAVDDPGRPWVVGVQWHPERGGEGPFSLGLLRAFVSACHTATTA